eukprot:360637-Chlamydomonas_euryale.AAC.8
MSWDNVSSAEVCANPRLQLACRCTGHTHTPTERDGQLSGTLRTGGRVLPSASTWFVLQHAGFDQAMQHVAFSSTC